MRVATSGTLAQSECCSKLSPNDARLHADAQLAPCQEHRADASDYSNIPDGMATLCDCLQSACRLVPATAPLPVHTSGKLRFCPVPSEANPVMTTLNRHPPTASVITDNICWLTASRQTPYSAVAPTYKPLLEGPCQPDLQLPHDHLLTPGCQTSRYVCTFTAWKARMTFTI